MKLLQRYIEGAVSTKSDYYDKSVVGTAYKVFRVKDGRLYPPMVDNPGGVDTPVGVWLDAEEGEFAGLNTENRPMVKSSRGSRLAYRPGWHLGDEPYAPQFDAEATWEIVDELPDGAEISSTVIDVPTPKAIWDKAAKQKNYGKYVYVESTGQYVHVIGTVKVKKYFPYNFVWAKCKYVMNIDYQEEAHQGGMVARQVKYKLLPDIELVRGKEYRILQFTQGANNVFNVTFSDRGDIRIDGYPFDDLIVTYNDKDYVAKEIQDYFLQDNIEIIQNIIDTGSSHGKELMTIFVHRYGDIKHIPADGYYKYRTNPDPTTIPWVITGAIKVLELLGDDDVNDILRQDGMEPVERQGGNLTIDEILSRN